MTAFLKAGDTTLRGLPETIDGLWSQGESIVRRFLSAIPAAIYTCDAQGRVTFFNDAAAALWGRRPELGRDLWCGSWRIYTPEGDPLPLENCPMAVALREQRPVRDVEITIERPDGARLRVLPHPEPIRDDSGAVIGAVNMLLDVTERRRAEQAQATLAAIVESSQDAIVSKTLEGEIVSWNAGAEKIFGYTAQEAVGRSITMIIPEDRLDEEVRILSHLRRGERVEHFETVRVRKDGHPVDISVSISPVRDGAGRIVGASKIARDVTAQRAAERAQALLAAIVESSDDAIVSKTLDGRVVSWNAGAERLFGYPAEEIVGRPITTIIPEDRLAEEHTILQQIRRGRRVEHYQTVRQAKDGHLVDVSVTVSPIRDRAGRIVGASKIGRDITAQKAAERALRESEQNLRALLALLPVGVYACDAEGRITFYNRKAVELWGREPADELRYCACARMYRMDGSPLGLDEIPMALAVREGKAFRAVEAVLERPDGDRIHVSVNADPILDADGRPIGAINAFHDISVQVRARRTLENQHAMLADAVAERTRELEDSHRRLRLSERMASLGTLSAGLGHDVGNLLLPVRVSLEALAAAHLPEASRADLDRIRTSTEYLQQLASGLRMLALDPERSAASEPTDLAAWWTAAHAIIRSAIPRGIELQVDIERDCCVAMSRPALTQAIFNLVQNAADALRSRDDGRIRIAARCHSDRVVLTVEDNGPGMTPEIRDRCMEPFFSTKTRAISTGLGLVLVAGLVRDAGGAVQVRTSPGEGAAFTLTLPAANPPPTHKAGPRSGRAAIRVSSPRLRAVVAAELDHLSFEVLDEPNPAGAPLDLAVVDQPLEPLDARRIVLIGDANGQPPHVIPVGAKPGIGAVRRAIREAAHALAGHEDPAP